MTGALTAVGVVDAQLDAYVAGDAPGFARLYAEDALCERLPAGSVVAAGRTQIEEVWGAMFARRRARFELVSRLAIGNFVVDLERITRTDDGVVIEAIAAYWVVDGLIQRVWFLEPPTPAA